MVPSLTFSYAYDIFKIRLSPIWAPVMPCNYPDCQHPLLLNEETCLWHAPRNKKGITPQEFYERVNTLANGGHYNFEGFIISGNFIFDRKDIHATVNFKNAVFRGTVDFTHHIFNHGANFDGAVFYKGLNLDHATFGRVASFRRAKFRGTFRHEDGHDKTLSCIETQFTAGVSFHSVRFYANFMHFLKARFTGQRTSFDDARIRTDRLVFEDCKFESNQTSFSFAKIKADFCEFRNCLFTGETVLWINTCFLGKTTSFNFMENVFENNDTIFTGTVFRGKMTRFEKSDFLSRFNVFTESRFLSKRTWFNRCSIRHSLIWNNLRIGGIVKVEDLRFEETALFKISDLQVESRKDQISVLAFLETHFPPFRTYFYNVGRRFVEQQDYDSTPRVLFRYCNLRNVYFSDCNMSCFSFYKSAFFEESFFTDSRWQDEIRFLYTRKYLAFEDLYWDEVHPKNSKLQPSALGRELLEFGFPREKDDVAEIYLRLKASADKAKDYNLASWFYFNEFEMKLRNLVIRARNNKKRWLGFWIDIMSPRIWQYRLYKLFAGYGEKPNRSLSWFVIATLVFGVCHLFNGISIVDPEGIATSVNYEVDLTDGWVTFLKGSFWSDLFQSTMFSLGRVVPSGYLPGLKINMAPLETGPWDYLLSLSNSISLILLIVFAAIGYKRHFRRF